MTDQTLTYLTFHIVCVQDINNQLYSIEYKNNMSYTYVITDWTMLHNMLNLMLLSSRNFKMFKQLQACSRYIKTLNPCIDS